MVQSHAVKSYKLYVVRYKNVVQGTEGTQVISAYSDEDALKTAQKTIEPHNRNAGKPRRVLVSVQEA